MAKMAVILKQSGHMLVVQVAAHQGKYKDEKFVPNTPPEKQ